MNRWIVGCSLLVSVIGCKTTETKDSSTSAAQLTPSAQPAPAEQPTELQGQPLQNEELAKVIYDQAREQFEGPSRDADVTEVKSLGDFDSFKFAVTKMEGGGQPVGDLAMADAVQVEFAGWYRKTVDAYENPDAPEDSCVKFAARIGLQKKEKSWQVPEGTKLGVISENASECM